MRPEGLGYGVMSSDLNYRKTTLLVRMATRLSRKKVSAERPGRT